MDVCRGGDLNADSRTPLSKARGLGSAKSGVGHFIAQRVSAIALIFLIPIFIVSLVRLPGYDYESAKNFVGSPVGALIMLSTLTAALYHMRLGLQTVVEDYISKQSTRSLLLMFNTFIAAAAWLVILYSIITLAA